MTYVEPTRAARQAFTRRRLPSQIWDDNVSLGRLIGSNRQYIEEVIPHIGSLLSNDLAKVIAESEVVVLGTRA